MPRIAYEAWTPGADALDVIQHANAIARSYRAQGYDLTLRQLYYQFVARGLIPNTDRSYKRLGSIVNKARLAGLLDWSYIVDRTRNLQSLPAWDDPPDLMGVAARGYRIPKWDTQPVRVEVWVEKEALAGVVGQVADRWQVPWFSCRGYVSQSELWAAGRRLLRYVENGQRVVVLHLGDHDPSGIDMTRDITARLDTFTTQDYLNNHEGDFVGDSVATSVIRSAMRQCAGCAAHQDAIEVRRIALTWEQVQEYQPPPNPAKLTDSRVAGYLERYGDESWELDALDPATLDALIEEHIRGELDADLWYEAEQLEEEGRELMTEASDRWDEVVTFLRGEGAA